MYDGYWLPTWNVANSFLRIQYLIIFHHLPKIPKLKIVLKENKYILESIIKLISINAINQIKTNNSINYINKLIHLHTFF